MSRHHPFVYTVRLPGVDLFEVFDQISNVIPDSCDGGGGSSGDEFEFWLWANKTKAQRLADRLDRYFGTRGSLRRLGD